MTPERMKELEALDEALGKAQGQSLLRRDGTHAAVADTLQDLRAVADRSAHREYTLAARRRTRTVRLRWASALSAFAATAAALVVMLVPTHRPAPLPHDQTTATHATLSDDSLLTAVQNDLSASVPLPMEALTPTANTSSSNSSTQ